ncbi:MAG: hypothetical protein KY432_08490, partial [Acidobacteria bacterium]|nr:hypothetical protein [Acidobacteriota bacterium]
HQYSIVLADPPWGYDDGTTTPNRRIDNHYPTMELEEICAMRPQIDRVTTEQVNRAIRKHLQTENLKYVFITNEANAATLVSQIRANQPAYGKSLADYELQKVTLEDGLEVWQVPEGKLEMLRGDALWANYPLNIDSVRKVSVEKIFETDAFIAD